MYIYLRKLGKFHLFIFRTNDSDLNGGKLASLTSGPSSYAHLTELNCRCCYRSTEGHMDREL